MVRRFGEVCRRRDLRDNEDSGNISVLGEIEGLVCEIRVDGTRLECVRGLGLGLFRWRTSEVHWILREWSAECVDKTCVEGRREVDERNEVSVLFDFSSILKEREG